MSGKNLLNVCKLVFKISRSEKNDSLMQKDNILGKSPSVPPGCPPCTLIEMPSPQRKRRVSKVEGDGSVSRETQS